MLFLSGINIFLSAYDSEIILKFFKNSDQQSNWLRQMTKDFHIVFYSFAMLKSGSEMCAMSDFFFLFPQNIIQLSWKVFWKDEASCWKKKKRQPKVRVFVSFRNPHCVDLISEEFRSVFWRIRIAKSLSNFSEFVYFFIRIWIKMWITIFIEKQTTLRFFKNSFRKSRWL